MSQEISILNDVEIWLELKCLEFSNMGYKEVRLADLYDYLVHSIWKNNRPKNYYQGVRDILNIQPNDYFNYVTLQVIAYDVPNLEDMDIDDLF